MYYLNLIIETFNFHSLKNLIKLQEFLFDLNFIIFSLYMIKFHHLII
jgi:hypothetical protein